MEKIAKEYFTVATHRFAHEAGYSFLQDKRGLVAHNPLHAKRFRSASKALAFLNGSDVNPHEDWMIVKIRRFDYGISSEVVSHVKKGQDMKIKIVRKSRSNPSRKRTVSKTAKAGKRLSRKVSVPLYAVKPKYRKGK